MSTIGIEPLIRKKVFATEEEALQTLLRAYFLRQINALEQEIERFEQKYGMNFRQFNEYLHERSVLLAQGDFAEEERRALGQAIHAGRRRLVRPTAD